MSRADYVRIRCPECGWSGWSDTGVPECDCHDQQMEDSGKKQCGNCDEWTDEDVCSCGSVRCDNCGEWYDETEDLCPDCNEPREIETFTKVTYHVACKDHYTYARATTPCVRSGERYRRTVTGGYRTDGPRWLTVHKGTLGVKQPKPQTPEWDFPAR